ncbi:MAG: tRNA glutamyl-Q(34) synthetase GluQRS [Betaproteobacteria bacterium]|nr:tRNA glutamyl-Q(34) synthetase GluQRS [Betaproteobacteria bacterium]
MPYVGRFAPSPTGPLHFGSLVAALASWLDARAAGGAWRVRMEDLDRPREQPGAAAEILRQLAALGLYWDGEVVTQASRTGAYQAALSRLDSAQRTYHCGCTRREMEDSALAPDGARIYPGTCRNGIAPGKSPRAVRVRTDAEPIRFTDRVQGAIAQSVEGEVGDFVLLRADGLYAYQLAVVVDDAWQGITDVVRGADLLDSTARQIHLQRLLGLPQPRYLHVPVAVNAAGEKLSKQTGAPPCGMQDIAPALAFLGHPAPAGIPVQEMLGWARIHWNPARIPRARSIERGD